MIDRARYGPWAVIAGGSEGVGAEFARLLAESGLDLVLIARKPGPLAATADTCRRLGAEVRTVAADLVDPGSVDRAKVVLSTHRFMQQLIGPAGGA
jgi:uncharacterized protein